MKGHDCFNYKGIAKTMKQHYTMNKHFIGGKLRWTKAGGSKSYEIEIIWSDHTRCNDGGSARFHWLISRSAYFQFATLIALIEAASIAATSFAVIARMALFAGGIEERFRGARKPPQGYFLLEILPTDTLASIRERAIANSFYVS